MSLLNYVFHMLSCPTYLMFYVVSCLTCIVPYMCSCSRCFMFYVLSCLKYHMLSCASSAACSCALRVLPTYMLLCPTCLVSYVLSLFWLPCLVPSVFWFPRWLVPYVLSCFMSHFFWHTLSALYLTLCANISFCALEFPHLTLLYLRSFLPCDFFGGIYSS